MTGWTLVDAPDPAVPSIWSIPEPLKALLFGVLKIGAVVIGALVITIVMVAIIRRIAPRVYWWTFGWTLLRIRMAMTWRQLMLNADLTATDRPNTGLLGGLVVKGRPAVPLFPVLMRFRPRSFGATARIGMHAGQTPDVFIEAAEAMAHAWRVHAVRVTATKRGSVNLTILNDDPLAIDEGQRSAGPHPQPSDVPTAVPADLRADVGYREDGLAWVLDLVAFPHWLITGATQSGKSTLINAAVATWASRPIALVGIDCKGGMELAPHLQRLSALACDREEAAEVLTKLVAEATDRMRLCREHRARNIWQLPAEVRPVPVVVIVDELAELYLVAGRHEKDAALRATTSLLRLGQLGAALGIHLVVAGQRVGSDLGPGVTALRAQLAGRVCLKVNDSESAKMTLEDLYPDAVEAAQAIGADEKGVAITTADDSGWVRARPSFFVRLSWMRSSRTTPG
ncbi:FtsK/SpoIIIE domain-containing protein [Actinoplanes sp. NPDC089786]|uniref:FtsK/SpoIIIE domain-containing protein n=1 Tax=Actinoplanes sp. NPDC089786 TaxID=3155185 RepID=UPI003427DCE2